jgi:glutamate-1-semialdehyde 2,1-aminomutase
LNEAAILLAERLAAFIPCAEELIFTTTGSEATFYALRMARAYSGKNKILKFEGGYHGNHDYAAVSMFPNAPGNYPAGSLETGGVPDVLPDTVLVAPYNDLEVVERLVVEYGGDLAAIIVEPVQRIIFAQPGFLAGLRRICDAHGLVLIFDEVVTGFRLALGGGQEYYGVMPDLASYGKIVGGGGPLGCVAGRAEIIDLADPKRKGAPDYAYINGTLHGNPVAAAAGLATLELVSEPGFHAALHAKAAEVTAAFQDVLDRHGLPALAAGRNSFWQFLFLTEEPVNQADIMSSDQARMRALDLALLQRGIYVLPGMRRFVSAVNTEEDLTRSVEALDAACRTI